MALKVQGGQMVSAVSTIISDKERTALQAARQTIIKASDELKSLASMPGVSPQRAALYARAAQALSQANEATDKARSMNR